MTQKDRDEFEAEARAVCATCIRVLMVLLGLAVLGIWLASCAAPKSSTVRWEKRPDGKETLEVSYDPGNHIRIGNLIFPLAATP